MLKQMIRTCRRVDLHFPSFEIHEYSFFVISFRLKPNVLFDIGGVLVDWHMSWITSEVSKRFDISEDLIISAFDKHLPKLDSGKIDEPDFWHSVAVDVESDLQKNNKESLWDTYFRKNAIPTLL